MLKYPVYDVRSAVRADAQLYPLIENSAGQLFETWPALAWVALEKDRSVSEYRDLIALGWCWTATGWNGQSIGFVCAMRQEAKLHIVELAVAQNWQGRGIGRSLLERVIAEAKAHLLSAITLTTFRDPPWNGPFYIRCGFEIIDPARLSMRLENTLQEDNLRGFPRNYRCAMILSLREVGAAPAVSEQRSTELKAQGRIDGEI